MGYGRKRKPALRRTKRVVRGSNAVVMYRPSYPKPPLDPATYYCNLNFTNLAVDTAVVSFNLIEIVPTNPNHVTAAYFNQDSLWSRYDNIVITGYWWTLEYCNNIADEGMYVGVVSSAENDDPPTITSSIANPGAKTVLATALSGSGNRVRLSGYVSVKNLVGLDITNDDQYFASDGGAPAAGPRLYFFFHSAASSGTHLGEYKYTLKANVKAFKRKIEAV